MTAIIVDIYCRVSTDDQEDNTSLDEQEAVGRAYCTAHGLIVGEVWREVFSGYQYREREKLELMRERYREGTIQGVVIRTLDRLSRSQVHNAILMEEMEHYGIILHCVKEVIDDTPMGKFIRMVLAFVAEMEREKIMDRSTAGRVNKAKQGKVVSGYKPIYGWTWHMNEKGDKEYIVVDEQQAAVLRTAGQEYADGVSMLQIIHRLTEEGVPPPEGNRWHPKTLRRTLTDRRMIGKGVQIFVHPSKDSKQHIGPVDLPDGTYPPILSEELYERILERAATNAARSSRNSKNPEKFLLRAGFARCAVCNNVICAMTTKAPNGTIRYLYRCPRTGECVCGKAAVLAEKLDVAVWEAIVVLADHTVLIKEAIELATKNHSLEADICAVEATLGIWRTKTENYHTDLEDPRLRGDTRASIRQSLDAAYAMVEQLETQRAELMTHAIDRDRERIEYDKILAWCEKVKSEREELTYAQKRDFLALLGVTVLLDRQEQRGGDPVWDLRVTLPAIQDIIYQRSVDTIGGLGHSIIPPHNTSASSSPP